MWADPHWARFTLWETLWISLMSHLLSSTDVILIHLANPPNRIREASTHNTRQNVAVSLALRHSRPDANIHEAIICRIKCLPYLHHCTGGGGRIYPRWYFRIRCRHLAALWASWNDARNIATISREKRRASRFYKSAQSHKRSRFGRRKTDLVWLWRAGEATPFVTLTSRPRPEVSLNS